MSVRYQKDGRRVITVILNALNQPNDENARYVETSNLMDYCLNNWSQQDVTVAGQTPTDKKELKVTDGQEKNSCFKPWKNLLSFGFETIWILKFND